MNDFFSRDIISAIFKIGLVLLPFFFGILLERYKNRRLELKVGRRKQMIGLPSDSNLIGKLKISFDNNAVNSLYLFTIKIENNSNFDSENIPLNFYTDDESQILSYNLSYLPPTSHVQERDEYTNQLDDHFEEIREILSNNSEATIPDNLIKEGLWLKRNRQIHIDTLNRKDFIEFSILVSSQKWHHDPMLFMRIPKKSVVIKENLDQEKENKRNGIYTITIGFTSTLVILSYLVLSGHTSVEYFIGIGIIGSLNIGIGAILYAAGKFVYSYLK
ncbi:hypothetical protein [Sphingobacterium suaedae]|uniref:DUF3592 domain-containing protein n=1 Tax=Sphingobacterium suaedae TaxID=1686402 RepID=A0ABW5KFC4_9SPHI